MKTSFKSWMAQVKVIKEKCQPFLKEAHGLPMYRGVKFQLSDVKLFSHASLVQVRKDRRPSDTSLFVHNLMNDWFKEHYGVRARSEALFCTGNQHEASKYGKANYVFPVGDIRYFWAEYDSGREAGDPVVDTYTTANKIKDLCAVSPAAKAPEITNDILSHMKWYTDNLHEALNVGAELSIICDEAILVPLGLIQNYNDFLAEL